MPQLRHQTALRAVHTHPNSLNVHSTASDTVGKVVSL